MENMLNIFCHQCKNILNMIIEKNPSLLFGSFKVAIRKHPNIISFENRRRHFYEEIKPLHDQRYQGSINLNIKRKFIFEDSFEQIKPRKKDEMFGRIRINFSGVNDHGTDAGGLTREWFLLISKAMLNPGYCLFEPT